VPPKLKHFLFRWANNTVGVVVATYIVHGIHWQKPLDLVMAAFFLGILNTFVRPILMVVSLPVLLLTLGLFTFVINGLLLYLVGWLMNPHFEVTSFWAAFWGAIVITITAGLLNKLTGTSNSRITVRRGTPPGGPGKGGGSGPVIDV
jgi:putative membrane protein